MSQSFSAIQQGIEQACVTALLSQARAAGAECDRDLFERCVRQDPARPDQTAADAARLRGLFKAEPPIALVAFDTPGIQDYVFKVSRPVDLFGGSQLVADFTSREPSSNAASPSIFERLVKTGADVIPETVIYAGGGGGLLLLPAHKVKSVKKELAALLRGATAGDLLTATASIEIWPEDLSSDRANSTIEPSLEPALGPLRPVTRYAATISALFARLGRERSGSVRLAAPILAEQQIERCTACGDRTGAKRDGPGGEEEILCPPCARRRQYGGRTKRDGLQARTFEDLVADLPVKSMAVIYADGANVGATFQQLGSMAQHRGLSEAVDSAFRAARDAAVDECPLAEGDETLRFQSPICGGDDLVLVIPAIAAFQAASTLMREIESAFDLGNSGLLRGALKDAPEPLRDLIASFGVGIGVAIAGCHFPARFLFSYAKQLLASAKRHIRDAKRRASGDRSAIDFMVLSSGNPLSADIAELRAEHFSVTARNGEPGLRYSRRPYTRAAFGRFVERAELLRRHVPPSQIQAMRQELRRGHALSRSLWRYQHARARPGEGWAAYREALGVDLADVDGLLWEPDAGEEPALTTDLLDAVEVLSLLGESTVREAAA